MTEQTVVIAKKEIDDSDLCSQSVLSCPHAFTSGYPEADEVMLDAVKSACRTTV